MRRIVYLAYYLRKLDRKKFLKFLNYVHTTKGTSKFYLIVDILFSSLRYNISLLEYFQFRSYEIPGSERKLWAGTGYMYEYQRIMNPPGKRNILDDKTLFYRSYREFMKHLVADINDIENFPALEEKLLSNPSCKLVFKVYNGKCGQQVAILNVTEMKDRGLQSYMKSNGFDIVEEYIEQHPLLMKLSPSAVNTVRIFTQLNSLGEVVILGSRLRISVNSPVDNMAAGNIAAPIDDSTGVLTGPAVYSDITRNDEDIHPITGTRVEGFKVPFWPETIALAKSAAARHPQNRSIGWDIAVTENGPDLIEGNHDWCKLVWQLPVRKGLKPILEMHAKEYKPLLNNSR